MIEAAGVSVSVAGATLLATTSFEVQPGESVAVRGANGSGKTTLLRLLSGKLAPSTGRVRIAGERVDDRDSAFRRRVAGAIGLPPFARDLTLSEHLTLIGATWGRPADAARMDAEERLSELGMTALGDRFPHELSSGQTQLAALALVLTRPFDVLLLDEPEQRLDLERVDTVVRALTRVREAGATVVVATHSDRIAEGVADRSIALADAA